MLLNMGHGQPMFQWEINGWHPHYHERPRGKSARRRWSLWVNCDGRAKGRRFRSSLTSRRSQFGNERSNRARSGSPRGWNERGRQL